MSKGGIGYVAANGRGVKNHGEKKIVGYADDGESVSTTVQRADVKKALFSVDKMNLGGNAAALDGGIRRMQNKVNGQKTRLNHEEGQRIACLRLPSKEEEAQEEMEEVLKDNRIAIPAVESEQAFSRRV